MSLPAIKPQVQPNNWSCLPTAFAIAMGVNLRYVLEWIGHDGSEIIWPDQEEPFNRRSFHIQELIDYAWWRMYNVTPFEAIPRSISLSGLEPYNVKFKVENMKRLMLVLTSNRGVITGVSRETNKPHAVAWDSERGRILNPNGEVQNIDAIAIGTFWAIGRGS